MGYEHRSDSQQMDDRNDPKVRRPAGDEAIKQAIRAGCSAAEIHLTCNYPDCACKSTPTVVRAALAEYWLAKGSR